MPEIRIEKLRKVFGDLVAIDDLDLQVKEGEYLTILGPTGAGKTTLLRLIAGLTIQTSGCVFIKGKSQELRSNDVLLFVSYLAEDAELYGPQSVQHELC